MTIFIKKTKAEILREELAKLERETPISATGPGSIARSFSEAIAEQLGDVYDALDFNLSQSVLSSASGKALDMLGSLYNVTRKTVADVVAIDRSIGAFYFYIDATYTDDIVIPINTNVYTRTDTFIGRQLSYKTTQAVTIRAGKTKAFASIAPNFADSLYTAGVGSLTIHDAVSPSGTLIKCTNPKSITPRNGYETDSNYRTRIMKEMRRAASGTYDAIRFTGLSVAGVREIRIFQAPYGMGSFEVLVVPEEWVNSRQMLNEAIERINKVRPIGVKMYASLPSMLPLQLELNIIAKGATTDELTMMNGKVQVAISRYLNSLLPGDTLVYNKFLQAILETSERIQDVQITRYAPNGVEAPKRNYTPEMHEQIVPGNIQVNTI